MRCTDDGCASGTGGVGGMIMAGLAVLVMTIAQSALGEAEPGDVPESGAGVAQEVRLATRAIALTGAED